MAKRTHALTLYAAPMSSASPVVMALAELDVPHELVMLDLSARDQKQPDFLAKNPHGRVPTLVIDETPMFEALAILQWLGDTYGVDRKLWPAANTPERLEALSWTTWAYVSYTAVVQRLLHASSDRVPAEYHNAALAAASHAELQVMLTALEGRLKRKPYLLGDAFSLADLVLGCGITWSTYCGVSVDAHPHIVEWLARFRARPSFAKTWGG